MSEYASKEVEERKEEKVPKGITIRSLLYVIATMGLTTLIVGTTTYYNPTIPFSGEVIALSLLGYFVGAWSILLHHAKWGLGSTEMAK